MKLVATIVLGAALAAQQPDYTPAKLASGGRPALQIAAVGGGQAFVELTVGPSGSVTQVTPLRSTPPFTAVVADAASAWTFTPAVTVTRDAEGKPEPPKNVPSKILAAAIFRPPTLVTPTLGEPPKDVGKPSAEVAYPTGVREPPYPPQAHASGVVMIEARVDESGKVAEAAVIGSAPPFDAPALEAAKSWRFRPARVGGRPTATYVYLIFGFREPVTTRQP